MCCVGNGIGRAKMIFRLVYAMSVGRLVGVQCGVSDEWGSSWMFWGFFAHGIVIRRHHITRLWLEKKTFVLMWRTFW